MSRARKSRPGSEPGFRPIEIRPAAADDIPTLSELAARTFRATFADQNTPEDMQAHVEGTFSIDKIRREVEAPGSTVLLAIDADLRLPVGYAQLQAGSANAAVASSKPIELERLYVDQSHQRYGVGSRLMRACLAEAGRTGAETMWLGVWERNRRAIEFYRRWDFEVVGKQVFRLGSDDQTDLVMARGVTGQPTAPEESRDRLSDR